MQTAQRRLEPGVIERLLRQPYRFEFVQAVRVLLQWLARNGVPPERALLHLLRFQNSVSLSFPASQIEALVVDAGAHVEGAGATALLAALRENAQARIRITPAFMGLLGVGGALPLHYTERVQTRAQQSQGDSARAFFDIFSNRMPALYFQGWGKYRLEHRLDIEGRDAWLPLLLALGGASAASFGRRADGQDNGGVGADVGAHYAGLIRQRPVSACAVGRVLSDYFGVPIALEQFIGAWDPIPADRVCRLGGPNAVLGHTAALGERIWREDVRVRLRVGPLDKAGLERFLPNTAGSRALEKMLATFDLGALQCEVLLLMRADCVEPATLAGANQSSGPRLGWDAYLVSGPQAADRAEVRYLLRPS